MDVWGKSITTRQMQAQQPWGTDTLDLFQEQVDLNDLWNGVRNGVGEVADVIR